MRATEPAQNTPYGHTAAKANARLVRSLPVIVTYVTVALFAAAVAVRLPWNGDLGLHVAVVEQFSRHLVHPPDPLTGAPGNNPYYSPYSLAQALLARTTGLSGQDVLRICAVVNILLFATGVQHVIHRLTRDRWAPPLALAAIVLLQGDTVRTWSGFLGLTSLVFTASYPSTFALGLTLHLWGLLCWKLAGGDGWWAWLLAGALAAEITLDHPFTAISAALGILAMVALRARQATWTTLAAWALTVGLYVLLVVTWPYFSVLQLARSTGDLDAIHHALYTLLFPSYGLALLTGLPVLALRFCRHRLDPLALLAAFSGLLVCYGDVSGHYAWGRAIPVLLLSCQLAVGIEAATLLRLGGEIRVFGVTAVGVAMLTGLCSQASAISYFIRVPDTLAGRIEVKHDWGRYRWITGQVAPGQVILTDSYHALRMAPAYRILTVAPAYPEPWAADEERRKKDNASMLDPATSNQRRRTLLTRYRVAWLVTYPSHAARLRHVGVGLTEVADPARYPERLYRFRR